MNINSLRELDDFQKYKQFIRDFILQDETLFRLIYFCNKNVFDEEKCEMPENPYKIFTTDKEYENDNHGVILFKQKNGEILNYGTVVVLVNFETTRLGNSSVMDNMYIIFRIIAKSEEIQELEDDEGNTVNRLYAIAECINNNCDHARVGNTGELRKQSMNALSINEENCGITLMFKTSEWGSKLLSRNKNYRKQRC